MNDHDMTALREMRAEIPEPDPAALSERIPWRPGHPAGQGAPSSAARRGWRARPLPLATAGAAVLAVGGLAAVAALNLQPLAPPADPGTAAGTDLGAEEILLAAATAAEQGETGEVWHVRSVWGSHYGAGPEGDCYAMDLRWEYQEWATAEQTLAAGRDLAAEPATDADRAAWERDGSPTTWEEVSSEGEAHVISGEESEIVYDSPGESQFIVGGEELTFEELQELPTDPDELRDIVEASSEVGADELGPSGGPGPTDWGTVHGAILLMEYALSPETRAGLFELLAGLSDVRSLGEVTDVLGRAGSGVAIDVSTEDLGDYEFQVIVDPDTGMLLAHQEVVVEPSADDADWLEPGDVFEYRTFEEMTWTDELPEQLD